MTAIAQVLLSGGLASAVTLAEAIADSSVGEGMVGAVAVDYGQKNENELEHAEKLAKYYGIGLVKVSLAMWREGVHSTALESSLMRHDRGLSSERNGIPPHYVPLRNTMLISAAAALLESRVLRAMEIPAYRMEYEGDLQAAVYYGASADGYAGFPDCRPQYIWAMESVLRLGSAVREKWSVDLELRAPLQNKSKAEIIQLGRERKVPLELTWSCLANRSGRASPCGGCSACAARAAGFAEAGIDDPAL